MSNTTANGQAIYGTWIRSARIRKFWLNCVFFAVAGSGFFVVANLIGGGPGIPGLANVLFVALGIASAALAIMFALIAGMVNLAAWRFSPAGGHWQDKVHGFVQTAVSGQIDATGSGSATPRILDIGCGSGHLTIKVAKALPGAEITGLDYWGDDWEYSMRQCQRNATIEGQSGIRFLKASAAALPAELAGFDLVYSCLTFHEVRGVPDRCVCLAQALRVLRPGGAFVFFDLFDDQSHYPDQAAIAQTIADNGGTISRSVALREVERLPFPIAGRQGLGKARLLVGRKA